MKKEEKREEKYVEEKYIEIIKEGIGASGLPIIVKDDPTIPTAAFDHEKNLVIINPRFTEEYKKQIKKNLVESAEKYIISHELMHWRQLAEDHQGYMQGFDYIKEWSEGDKGLEFIWKVCFNCVYDIDANTKIENIFLPFAKERSESETPLELYSNILFKEEDLRKMPKSLQFSYALLREKMLGKAIIDKDVEQLLEEKVKWFGKERSIKELVYYVCNGKHKASTINYVIREFIKPRLEKLIEKDKNEGKLPKVLEFPLPDFGDGAFDDKKAKYGDYLKKKHSSIEEKIKRKIKKEIEDLCKSAGLDEEETERIAEILENNEKYVERIKELWYRTIHKRKEVTTKQLAGFKSGYFDVKTAIKQWPVITTRPEEATPFYRYVDVIKEEILPKSIKCVVILDMSGSMTDDRRKRVQECVYPILKSLHDFELELAINARKGKPLINVETYIIGFGTNAIELPEKKLADPLANITRAIIDFHKIDLKYTHDAEALKLAYKKFSEEDFEKIKKGELLGLVLEITDGETQTKEESRELIKKMNEKGILVKGIKIVDEGGIFEEVWGKHGKKVKSAEQLKPALEDLLKNVLVEKKVKIEK